MRVALLGLGLIGGSIARAVHAAGWEVHAWTPGGAGPRAARAAGVVDGAPATLESAVRDADLVVARRAAERLPRAPRRTSRRGAEGLAPER